MCCRCVCFLCLIECLCLCVMCDAMLYGLSFRAFVIVRVMFLLINVFACFDCDLGCDYVWFVWLFLLYRIGVLVCVFKRVCVSRL